MPTVPAWHLTGKMYQSALDFTHGASVAQEIFYVPGKGLVWHDVNYGSATDPATIKTVSELLEKDKHKRQVAVDADLFDRVLALGTVQQQAKSEFTTQAEALLKDLLPAKVTYPEPVAVPRVDPATIGPEQKARLESIVNACPNPNLRVRFLEAFGDRSAADALVGTHILKMHPIHLADILTSGNVPQAMRQQAAQKVYAGTATENPVLAYRIARDYKLQPRNLESVQSSALMTVMTGRHYESFDQDKKPYLDVVRELATGLPAETLKKLAKKAYDGLIKEKQPGSAGAAVQLATEFGLGPQAIAAAKKSFIDAWTDTCGGMGDYDTLLEQAQELGLDEQTIRPAVLHVCRRHTFYTSFLERVRKEQHLPDNEYQALIQEGYDHRRQMGDISSALSWREKYPFIKDSISVEDLRTLVGLLQDDKEPD